VGGRGGKEGSEKPADRGVRGIKEKLQPRVNREREGLQEANSILPQKRRRDSSHTTQLKNAKGDKKIRTNRKHLKTKMKRNGRSI